MGVQGVKGFNLLPRPHPRGRGSGDIRLILRASLMGNCFLAINFHLPIALQKMLSVDLTVENFRYFSTMTLVIGA